MRLLVIEDNRQLVANLFDYFESRGHVLDVAPDGITGLHLAGSHPYDAVIPTGCCRAWRARRCCAGCAPSKHRKCR